MPDNKSWIVTTSGDRPIDDIAKDLKAAGFNVGQVLDTIGSITGAAGEETIRKVRSIAGVADVAPDIPVDVGPPDSDENW